MAHTTNIATNFREQLLDITQQVEDVVSKIGIKNGLVAVYAQGATGAIIIETAVSWLLWHKSSHFYFSMISLKRL
ncbi:MAG: YjbQ family protein [Magnetococcales bacterium]|nr:YjbQ family protein [Magnetococcales bacterium]